MRITLLGNGDSMGTPRMYCDCAVCAEARESGANRRYRSSAWLEEAGQPPLLLDCGPDFRLQMESLGVRRVEQAIVTHAHIDHIAGVTDWADGCRWLGERSRMYAPQEVLDLIGARYPWVGNQLEMVANDEGMTYGPWAVRPWKVNHGKNGYAYAYRFDDVAGGRAWAYCSDAIQLTEEQQRPLLGLDLLVLGTSFVLEPYPMETRSVYDMKEGVALAEKLRPGRVVFTHLSHDVDARKRYGLPANVSIAATGMTLEV
ncbi:MBL fold metallo-hydrolase [Cohnella sp. GCM10027633]|uniref:MBL fold metallo-hydrolase n=1 Tax=unclassified Cohnella TaxID=2636738 RepID=UPI0036435D08